MNNRTRNLIALDHEHVWHPFTPMRQWRDAPPLVIERTEAEYLIDTQGKRYIDGVSSLWCNVHGHRVPAIDQAIRAQLDKVAHSTLLGLAGEQSILLAAELVRRAPAGLNKVFIRMPGPPRWRLPSRWRWGIGTTPAAPPRRDSLASPGRTMAIPPGRCRWGIATCSIAVSSMVFPTFWSPAPDVCRVAKPQAGGSAVGGLWPSEDPALGSFVRDHCLTALEQLLQTHAPEVAAIVLEPVMQGAAGMICQPAGFIRGVTDLARKHDVLLIADEVAVGFGRTGKLFACEHEGVTPDILCLAKGITGGYLPLAATLATDRIEAAFCGELDEGRTLFHGHTYTGNALACAAALASLALFDRNDLLEHINASAAVIHDHLNALRDCPRVLDIRQRGMMVGIELCRDRRTREPLDFAKRTGAELCLAMRPKGLIIRPLGDVLVLMPIQAMRTEVLHEMLDIVIGTVREWGMRG